MGYSPWGRKESDTTEQLSTRVSQSDLFSFFLSFSYLSHSSMYSQSPFTGVDLI